jgi:hypothetical protein
MRYAAVATAARESTSPYQPAWYEKVSKSSLMVAMTS